MAAAGLEELFTLAVKGEFSSYKDYPVILYQVQAKYRDFVMRVLRETAPSTGLRSRLPASGLLARPLR